MKKIPRKKSKRVTTRQRVKAEKKIRDYNRKLRKEKRKNPKKFLKSKKDPGVPNNCPFKEIVLQEVEEARRRKAEEKLQRREKIKQLRKEAKEMGIDLNAEKKKELPSKDAFKKLEELEMIRRVEREQLQRMSDRLANSFHRQFLKMSEIADVIVQLLDARDPIGTRCLEVENVILASSKPIVQVLNKADMVPRENLHQWLEIFRKHFPVVATTCYKSTKINQAQEPIGVKTLISVLKNFAKETGKSSLKFGIVGLANTGKRSLIATIKKLHGLDAVYSQTVEPVRSIPETKLDDILVLLDVPGTILIGGDSENPSTTIRNLLNLDLVENPESCVKFILGRVQKENVMLHYKIPNFESAEEFLSLISPRLKKRKNVPDSVLAARLVLNHWVSGEFSYFTDPTQNGINGPGNLTETFIKECLAKFGLGQFENDEKRDLERLPNLSTENSSAIQTLGAVDSIWKSAEEGKLEAENMEVEDEDESEGEDGDEDEDVSEDEDNEVEEEEEETEDEMEVVKPLRAKNSTQIKKSVGKIHQRIESDDYDFSVL